MKKEYSVILSEAKDLLYLRLKSRFFVASLLRMTVLLFTAFLISIPAVNAEGTVKVQAAMVIASNEGNDFDLVNDDYRDELIKLFSYSAYRQIDSVSRGLKKAVREKIDIEGGYELILTLQGVEEGRVMIQAVIRKEGRQYVDTVLSILKPGVVFVGGPPMGKGALIIILEAGY
jgi:hypothetical protein